MLERVVCQQIFPSRITYAQGKSIPLEVKREKVVATRNRKGKILPLGLSFERKRELNGS